MLRKSLILLGLAVLPLVSFSQDSKENADFKLALNLYNDGFYDLALEQFRQFVSYYPGTQQGIEARFYLAMSQFAMERYGESRMTFQNFALSYPDHPRAPEAWDKVGESYLKEGDRREAALALERIRTFHPRSARAPGALHKAANLFDELGDRENAVRLLRVLTQEYPTEAGYAANLRLAELYMGMDQYDAAMTEVRKIIEGSQEAQYKGPALYLQAMMMIGRGRISEARTSLQDIRSNYRGSAAYHGALFALAQADLEEGDIPGAVSLWSEIASDPGASPALRQRAYYFRGDAQESSMNTPEAHKAFDSARVLQGPLAASAAFRAGRISEREADTTSAVAYYLSAAADTSRTEDLLLRWIGGLKAAAWAGRSDLVETYASRIVSDLPASQAVPHALIIWAETELHIEQNLAQAEEIFRRVLRLDGGARFQPRALFGLAQSLERGGYAERAVATYDDLLRRYPASAIAKEARRQRERLLTFVVTDRDAGTEQLAYLLGDVIGEHVPSMLAFRLAEISFLQLKNFDLAREQYQRALDGGVPAEQRPAALMHLGMSLLYLSDPSARSGQDPDRLRAEALGIFEELLNEHPEHPLAQDAFAKVAQMIAEDATGIAQLEQIASRAEVLRLDGMTSTKVFRTLADRAVELGGDGRGIEWYGEALQGARDDAVRGELLTSSGIVLARSGATDTAIVVLSRSFDGFGDHPARAAAGLALAELSSARGDVERVRSVIDRLSGTYAYAVDEPTLILATADAAFYAGIYREAFASYDRYTTLLSQDAFEPRRARTDVVHRMARAAERSGERERALRLYGEVIARGPEADVLLSSWYAVASLAEATGDLQRASAAMDQASRLAGEAGGDVVSAALQSADLLFRTEQYQAALAKYQKVQAESASDSLKNSLESRIVVCYFRLNNLAEADKRATAFVRKNPASSAEAAEFEFERGLHHARQGRIDPARERFRIVVRNYPKDPRVPEALFWLGRLYEIGQQPDSAALVYEDLLQRYPQDDIGPRVELSLGNVYYALERWDDAATAYRKILDNRERSPDLVQYAMNNLILTYKELTLYDGALQLTREYISLYPEDPELINKRIDIGVLYQRLGYHEQSVVHLQDLLLSAPSEYEAELRYYIGEAYFDKAEYQQAILEFLKVPYLVIRQGPIDWIATSYYMAGQSYEKLSRYDQAIAMYQQIIDRRNIDAQFKTAAQREIDRVRALVGQRN